MLTLKQLAFLDQVCPNRWIEVDYAVNVEGPVDISHMNLTRIPVRFGQVNEQFDCVNNKLITLKGAPSIVQGSFYCGMNRLTTLEGGPKEVSKTYGCSNNLLTSLLGAPEICNNFNCANNNLTTLKNCPKKINNILDCRSNANLHILYGIGWVKEIKYDNHNDLNEWIIEQARKDIFSTYADIAKWIKDNNKLEYLLYAQQEIRQYFSPRILHNSDMGVYNESKNLNRIFNWKEFIHEGQDIFSYNDLSWKMWQHIGTWDNSKTIQTKFGNIRPGFLIRKKLYNTHEITPFNNVFNIKQSIKKNNTNETT